MQPIAHIICNELHSLNNNNVVIIFKRILLHHQLLWEENVKKYLPWSLIVVTNKTLKLRYDF
jgi:hypothetical protein